MDKLLPLIVVVSSIWVLLDARKKGIAKNSQEGLLSMGPWGWFFGSLIFWIIFFPLYLYKRRRA